VLYAACAMAGACSTGQSEGIDQAAAAQRDTSDIEDSVTQERTPSQVPAQHQQQQPGAEAPLIPATFSAEHVAHFGRDVPLKRPGQPEEVAPSYVFLASSDSSYMSGQVLHPNGGEIVES
jgi:hypothetical protein